MPAIPHFIEPHWPAPAGILAYSTTRQGGESLPPWDSFNLGHHVGDDAAAVAANRAHLAQQLPGAQPVAWLSQVHGTAVVEAGRDGPCPAADGVWSRRRGVPCAVMSADCLPVLFCSIDGDVVAAAHAGWRGLLAGVLEATVTAMGAAPPQLLAWLGPAIGPLAFEVGPEVRAAFLDAPGPSDSAAIAACFTPGRQRPGRYFADIYGLARLRLAAAGVTRVFGGDYCTYSDPGRFFSYRRDGQTGRMASLILLR